MYFPRYWKKVTLRGPSPEGEEVPLTAWGWSDSSEADAERHASARAQGMIDGWPNLGTKGNGGYYENRPFREEILQDVSTPSIHALVTRNSLGCEVLNADNLMFADIDESYRRLTFWESLFDSRRKKRQALKAEWAQQVRDSLRAWQRENPAWSFRIYRTAGGIRLLVTSHSIPADSAEADRWLAAVDADPLYRRLCRNQKTYRARLTPKAWRIGLDSPPMRSPWDTTPRKPKMGKWLDDYRQRSERFAVCEFLEAVGDGTVIPGLHGLIDLHDLRTAASCARPLA